MTVVAIVTTCRMKMDIIVRITKILIEKFTKIFIRYEEIDDELDESNIGNEINNFNFNNANDIGNAPEEIPEFDSQRIDNDKPYTTHTYLYKPITTTRNRRNIRLVLYFLVSLSID
ncbi:19922_t:CDS:2 [Entrophospora sp. SA101]|nr:19922_t:CDS:2 [Entrophospora sp. SA101]CAJ0829661.1 20265_t:CDS:2 [Entrophospora sp. SA101]CAJ0852013.1 7159_t:CDS:2 [Entrophospora sp. SA101]